LAITVDRNDPRYDMLKQSRNLRWPAHEADAVEEIELCETSEQAAEALQRIIRAGVRPTIRSGGHCYEDFVVNNPNGSILDLSLLTTTSAAGDGSRYRISPGQQLGDVYLELYKRHGVTIPAGTCYSVGAGGHISGGGYGLLSRLHGLTIDWLSQVELLTVDRKGRVELHCVDKDQDADLFRACRGGGGGNFGVITGFLFDRLPAAPYEVANVQLSFDWAAMNEDTFGAILFTFGDYFAHRGQAPETWGLFAILELTHVSSGRLGISVQFCNPDGRCDDMKVVEEFLDLFHEFEPDPFKAPVSGEKRFSPQGATTRERVGRHTVDKRLWLDATIGGSGSGHSGRAKYKSSYMRENFTPAESKCIYKHLTTTVPNVDLRSMVLSVDSYGGAANAKGTAETTSSWQRSSIMKTQFQHYWVNPEEDAARLKWTREFFSDLYSQHGESRYAGTPYPSERYEGCYINYPDSDMLAYEFWPQLYYGDKGLYPFLQKVKQRYDPNNIFHHAMSIRV
jgi:Berberine and berberine like/FAD binding domain